MALAFSSSTSSTSIGFSSSSSSSTLSHNVQAVFKVSGNNNFQPLDRSHRALPLNVSRNGFDTLKALNAKNVSIVPSAATTFAPADEVPVVNSILTMYGKCGEVESAEMLFEHTKKRECITCNSMLTCYTQNGLASEALSLFEQKRKMMMVYILE